MQRALTLMKEEMTAVEEAFKRHLNSEAPLVRLMGEYLLSSGGKRVRPLLLLLCARLAGYQGDEHILHATIIEYIHTATLLHDDVVDGADLRRGKKSANSLWGNEASVLVGDFLFARAFGLLGKIRSMEIIAVLSEAASIMAEGEILQLQKTGDLGISEDDYLAIIKGKTAILIESSCRIGGMVAERPEHEVAALQRFGNHLGVAFQLVDDTLDYLADQQEFGKAQGHDLAEGKITLPLIHTLAATSGEERSFLQGILAQKAFTPEEFTRVCDLITRTGGISRTTELALSHVELAKGELLIFPPGEPRDALAELADYIVARTR